MKKSTKGKAKVKAKKTSPPAKPKIVKKAKVPRAAKPVPDEFIIGRSGGVITFGALVKYYDEGWRHGYLESVKGQIASIRPLVSRYATIQTPRSARVPVGDVDTP